MSGARVFCDIACALGEGPAYDAASETLFWFDILGRKLLERPFAGDTTVVHDLPVMASAIAAIDAERQLLVAADGLYVRDRSTGRLTLHTPLEADKPLNRSNDARVHPCGAFWIGTMPIDEGSKAGAIYWFLKGELRLLYPGFAIPNSICFSPDGSLAYFTDTPTGLMMRVSCDSTTGLPSGEPKVFLDRRGGEGWIDGSIVDADGVLWNCRWGAGALDAWSPEGRLMRTIALPAKQSSCPAFVGPGAARMAVTSAFKGLSAAERATDPQAGQTFLLDIAVNGRFEPPVAL
ncbi:MAG: SMP-30/gluconolactonase/LRE family protein [Mesorhizobium sp.]|nr:SMP-30/gluconolactonase/LRE family protein [Mesorhizobium sp.]